MTALGGEGDGTTASPVDSSLVDEAIAELSIAQSILWGLALLVIGGFLVFRVMRRMHPLLPVPGPAPRQPSAMLAISVLLVQLLSLSALHILLPASEPAPAEGELDVYRALLCTVGGGLVALGVLLLALRNEGGRASHVGLTLRHAGPCVALSLLMFLACILPQLGAISLESGVYRALTGEAPAQEAVRQLSENPELRGNLPFLLLVILGVPFVEELLFRGVLLTVLLRHLKAGYAVVASAILFSLVHDAGNLAVLVQGLALGWLYARTRTLVAPVLFHVLHNGTVISLILYGSPAS